MSRTVRRIALIAAALAGLAASFGAGVFASDTVRSRTGTETVTCIDGVCVGAAAPRSFTRLNRDRQSLSAIYCDAEQGGRYMLLDEIVAGVRCAGDRYTVELRSPTERTLISVARGRVASIERGPLHTLDL